MCFRVVLCTILPFALYCSHDDVAVIFDLISKRINNILAKFHSSSIHIFGDFSIHHKYWLVQANKTDEEGSHLSIVYVLSQIIEEPTHVTDAIGHKVNLLNLFLAYVPEKFLAKVLPPIRDVRPSPREVFRLIANQSYPLIFRFLE